MTYSTPMVHPGLISVAPGLASHVGLLHMVHKGTGNNTNTFHSTRTLGVYGVAQIATSGALVVECAGLPEMTGGKTATFYA